MDKVDPSEENEEIKKRFDEITEDKVNSWEVITQIFKFSKYYSIQKSKIKISEKLIT